MKNFKMLNFRNTNEIKGKSLEISKRTIIISFGLFAVLSLSACNITNNNNNMIDNIKKETAVNISDNLNSQDNILKKYKGNYKGNTIINNFTKAKHILYKIYNKDLGKEFRKTIYCNCSFNGKMVDKKTCGLITKGYKTRSEKVEWEHIVPAENFGKAFKSWREGDDKCKYYSKSKGKYINYKGRKCAEKADKLFNLMEADLYNLMPADGALNAYRSNYQITEIPGEERKFGSCDFEIENRKVEPPQNKKGDIARVYMYMQLVYGKDKGLKIISKKNKKLIQIWNKLDPINKEECIVYHAKKKYQKNINPILEGSCKNILKQ